MFERILVAIDGQPEGQRALEAAIDLAATLDTDLHAVLLQGRLPAYAATVGEVEEARRTKDSLFQTIARLARDQAADAGIELDVELSFGPPAAAVVQAAESGRFDLIVVGHRRRPFEDHLLSSIADRVCHHASCPVLVVR